LDVLSAFNIPAVETDTTIEVLGYELTGYEIVFDPNEVFGDGPPSPLFAFARRGIDPVFAFGPGANGLLFAAETPSGVLTAGVGGNEATDEDIERYLAVLGSLIESIEFIGPGLDPALPEAQALATTSGEPPTPIEPSAPNVPLGQPYSPLTPDRFELLNFAAPISLDFDEGWWVQPNFPGFVVLAAPNNPGPGDRDIIFLNDVITIVPSNGGPTPVGEPLSLDIEEFIASPPRGVAVSDVERMTLEASDGSTLTALSFGIETGVDAACTVEEPCDLALATSYGSSLTLLKSHSNHVWWFPDHPAGQSIAVAGVLADTDWLDEARELMSTLELR